MQTALISHPDCLLHDMGPGHPEQPARLTAIDDRLTDSGLDSVLRRHEAPAAEREHLIRVHSEDYVDRIMEAAPAEGVVQLDPDTAMNPHTLSAALRAAGALVHAVDGVMTGKFDRAFCSVRPPGHHAEHARAMGFCFFNNVAVGAAHALAAHKLSRVAVVDFDVHHGNGTEDIFTQEPRVLFCSSFQHPFYPGSGADTVSDHILNVPLPAGTASGEYREAVEARWFEPLDQFKPELIFFSAGFDAHAEDPLAQLLLTEDDFGWITSEVAALADKHARGRIVSTLEGGYNLSALGRSVAAHLGAMMEVGA